jgi:hypothetical protein
VGGEYGASGIESAVDVEAADAGDGKGVELIEEERGFAGIHRAEDELEKARGFFKVDHRSGHSSVRDSSLKEEMPVFLRWLSGEVEQVEEKEASLIAYLIRTRKGLEGMRVRLFSEDGVELSDRCMAEEGEILSVLVEPDDRRGICRRRNRLIQEVREEVYGPVVYWIQPIGEEYEVYLLSRRAGIWSYSSVIGDKAFVEKILGKYNRV